MEFTVKEASSEERRKTLQEVINSLTGKNEYSLRDAMHRIGLKRQVSVSLYQNGDEITMNCKDRYNQSI